MGSFWVWWGFTKKKHTCPNLKQHVFYFHPGPLPHLQPPNPSKNPSHDSADTQASPPSRPPDPPAPPHAAPRRSSANRKTHPTRNRRRKGTEGCPETWRWCDGGPNPFFGVATPFYPFLRFAFKGDQRNCPDWSMSKHSQAEPKSNYCSDPPNTAPWILNLPTKKIIHPTILGQQPIFEDTDPSLLDAERHQGHVLGAKGQVGLLVQITEGHFAP